MVVLAVWIGILAPPGPATAEVPGPNGRILFVRYTATCEGCQLTTIDPDGSSPHRFPDTNAAAWSPDGARLASYVETADGRFATVVFDADGSNRTAFEIPDPTLTLPCTFWTPDGARLICEGWDDARPHRAAGMLSVSSSDGGDLVRITTNPYGGHDIPTDVAPDGSRIVFLRENPHHKRRPIAMFTVGMDGSTPTRISGWQTDEICCQMSWSPDGTQILFTRNGILHTITPDGATRTTITLDTGGDFAFAFNPTWSPDGTRIAFALYVGSTNQIDVFTAAADGTDLFQVTDTWVREGLVDWGAHPVESAS
jgi:Tol biopolymer transport system component